MAQLFYSALSPNDPQRLHYDIREREKNILKIQRMCVLPLTDCFGLKLHGKAGVASCKDSEQVSGGEEVSETGYVCIGQLFPDPKVRNLN